MNEQLIDELWQEAVDATWTDNSKAAYEKFAELIVRECAWFMEINTKVNDDGEVVDAPEAQQMLEHFGVE